MQLLLIQSSNAQATICWNFNVLLKMYQNLLYKHRSKVNVNTQLPLGMNMKLLRRYCFANLCFFQNYIFLVTFLHMKINLKMQILTFSQL